MDTIEINREKRQAIGYKKLMANRGPDGDRRRLSRLIMWLRFKPTFFKYLFNVVSRRDEHYGRQVGREGGWPPSTRPPLALQPWLPRRKLTPPSVALAGLTPLSIGFSGFLPTTEFG